MEDKNEKETEGQEEEEIHAPEAASEEEKEKGYVSLMPETEGSKGKAEYTIGKFKFSFSGGLTRIVMLIALIAIVCWLMVSQIGVTRQVFNVNIENMVNTITQQTAKIQSLEQRFADFIK